MLRSIIRNAGQFIGEAEHKFKIDSGNVIWGHEVTVGYFPQDFGYTIDNSKGINALDWLWQFKTQPQQQEIRAALVLMLFSGEDALKPTSGLSSVQLAWYIFY